MFDNKCPIWNNYQLISGLINPQSPPVANRFCKGKFYLSGFLTIKKGQHIVLRHLLNLENKRSAHPNIQQSSYTSIQLSTFKVNEKSLIHCQLKPKAKIRTQLFQKLSITLSPFLKIMEFLYIHIIHSNATPYTSKKLVPFYCTQPQPSRFTHTRLLHNESVNQQHTLQKHKNKFTNFYAL